MVSNPLLSPPAGALPAEGPPLLELTASLSFGSASHNWGNPRRMALLQAIDDEGSISAGARKIGLSYKAAWDAVDTMNNLAGEALVERTTGGQRGGGARLTPRARSIVALYQTLHQAHARFVAHLAQLAGQENPDLDVIRNLMVQTSARNKLTGEVQSITRGETSDAVIVRVGDATDIVANVSRTSVQELGLETGRRVLVFIDAAAVVIGLPGAQGRLSARNQLAGRVNRITRDAVSVDISVQLEAGLTLVSQITPESLRSLALRKGRAVHAIFKASSVVLGVVG